MQSRRLLSCLLLLQGKPRTTARDLARQLDVSMRTVYRDVEALSVAGVPIHMERGPQGGIVLDDAYRRAVAQFTDDELQALFSAGAGPLADIGAAAADSALQKLAGALPAMQRRAAEAGRERLVVDHHRWRRGEQPADELRRLRDAISRNRSVRLHYSDRTGAPSERIVDPLGLVAKAGVWYLIAREAGKGYRTFRAQRIAAVDDLATTFERPAGFDLAAYWSESVRSIERSAQAESFEVVVRAAPASVVTLTTYWDCVVEREDAATSTLRVRFPAHDVAIVQLIALAEPVEILAPPGLRRAIVERARRAIRTYGGGPAGQARKRHRTAFIRRSLP